MIWLNLWTEQHNRKGWQKGDGDGESKQHWLNAGQLAATLAQGCDKAGVCLGAWCKCTFIDEAVRYRQTQSSMMTDFIPVSTRRWNNVALMLAQRLWRWPNIKSTMLQRLINTMTFFSGRDTKSQGAVRGVWIWEEGGESCFSDVSIL